MNSIWAFIVAVVVYSIGLASTFYYAGVRKGVEATLYIITIDNKNTLMDLISDTDKADVRGPEDAE